MPSEALYKMVIKASRPNIPWACTANSPSVAISSKQLLNYVLARRTVYLPVLLTASDNFITKIIQVSWPRRYRAWSCKYSPWGISVQITCMRPIQLQIRIQSRDAIFCRQKKPYIHISDHVLVFWYVQPTDC